MDFILVSLKAGSRKLCRWAFWKGFKGFKASNGVLAWVFFLFRTYFSYEYEYTYSLYFGIFY